MACRWLLHYQDKSGKSWEELAKDSDKIAEDYVNYLRKSLGDDMNEEYCKGLIKQALEEAAGGDALWLKAYSNWKDWPWPDQEEE